MTLAASAASRIAGLAALAAIAAVFPAAAQAPTVVTGPGQGIDSEFIRGAAEIEVTAVVPDGLAVRESYFEYGPTTAYGMRTGPGDILGHDGGVISSSLDGLQHDVIYHYRVGVVTTDGRTVVGEDRTAVAPTRPLRPRGSVLLQGVRKGATAFSYRRVVAAGAVGTTATVSSCRRMPRQEAACRVLRSVRVTRNPQLLARNVRVPIETRREGQLGRHPELRVRITGSDGTSITQYATGLRGPTPFLTTGCELPPLPGGQVSTPSCVGIDVQTSGRRIRVVRLRNLGSFSTAELACAGRGCPAAVTRIGPLGSDTSFQTLERKGYSRMAAGTRLDVYVTKPGAIGIHRRFTVRRSSVIRGDHDCIRPGTSRATFSCPA